MLMAFIRRGKKRRDMAGAGFEQADCLSKVETAI